MKGSPFFTDEERLEDLINVGADPKKCDHCGRLCTGTYVHVEDQGHSIQDRVFVDCCKKFVCAGCTHWIFEIPRGAVGVCIPCFQESTSWGYKWRSEWSQSWLEYVAMTPQEHFARQRNAEVRCLTLEAGGDGQNYTYQQCIAWFKSEGFTSGFAEKLWAKCAEHVVRPAGVSGLSGSGGPSGSSGQS